MKKQNAFFPRSVHRILVFGVLADHRNATRRGLASIDESMGFILMPMHRALVLSELLGLVVGCPREKVTMRQPEPRLSRSGLAQS